MGMGMGIVSAILFWYTVLMCMFNLTTSSIVQCLYCCNHLVEKCIHAGQLTLHIQRPHPRTVCVRVHTHIHEVSVPSRNGGVGHGTSGKCAVCHIWCRHCWVVCSLTSSSLLTQVSLHRDGLLPDPILQDWCTLTCILWGMIHKVLDSTKVCACVLWCVGPGCCRGIFVPVWI